MPDWLSGLLGTLSTSGYTVGGILGLSFILLNRGILWVRPAVDQLIRRHDEAIAELIKQKDLERENLIQEKVDALASQKDQYESRIREIISGKDEVRDMLQTTLTQTTTDRDAYKAALALERDSKDELTSRVVKEIVPLVQLTTKHMGAIEQIASGVDPNVPD